jgi:hypothetical protein
MLPNAEDAPSRCFECAADQAVSSDIAGELAFPETWVGCGPAAVKRATVPEAPVYKHGDPLARESEIGSTEEGPVATPTGDPVRL